MKDTEKFRYAQYRLRVHGDREPMLKLRAHYIEDTYVGQQIKQIDGELADVPMMPVDPTPDGIDWGTIDAAGWAMARDLVAEGMDEKKVKNRVVDHLGRTYGIPEGHEGRKRLYAKVADMVEDLVKVPA